MKRVLLWFFLLIAVPSWATLTGQSGAQVAYTTQQNPTISFSSAVNSTCALFLYVRVNDETTTISGDVTDTVNGAGKPWALIDGPDDHPNTTMRSYSYYLTGVGAGTPTVTVPLSVATSGHLAVAAVCTDTPSAVVAIDVLGTQNFSTSSGTDHKTGSITPNVAGATVGLFGGSGTGTITADTGETVLTTGSSRAWVTFKTHASGGSGVIHDVTTSSAMHSTSYAVAVKEQVSGSNAPRKKKVVTW